ncbi:MAG: 6-hydroxymethylpterin diphosphokinase MptE-like protein [Planctomycetota bacterium]
MQSVTPQAGPTDPRLTCYLTNLGALYSTDPGLAARLEQLPFAALPPLLPTRDGLWTTQVTADDGKAVTVHSRYQPLDEARSLIDTQAKRPREAPTGAESTAQDELENECFLVLGLGLGYHVAELERRFPRPFLIVAEDDLALLKAALCVTDLAVPLRERRLTFLTAADKSQIHERLRPILTALMLGLRFINPPHARRYHARFHTQISTLLRDFVSYGRLQMVSVVRNARLTCHNAAFNLAAYVAHPGVEVLAGRAAGYPAILVAAGPSLARNIDQLPALRDRAIIVAVQTVFRTLRARGCPPHFVTSLDYHEISAQFFRDVEAGDTILVAEPKVSWHVLDTFRGRTHVLNSGFLNDLLRDAAPTRGRLRAGSTVAHLAFYLAEHLGCDPIILVGQDLAFPEGLYYPPGMQIERIWQPELGRFVTVEMKQWERIVRSRSNLRRVKDIHGRDTYTDDQMFTYAEQFQSDFLASPARIIHATEGGRRLEGTEVMTLREAAEQYCRRPLPAGLFAADPAPPPADLKSRVVRALEQRLEELNETRGIATDTLNILERLAALVEQPAEFNRLVTRVDELRARMQRNNQTYGLVSQVSQLAELRRVHADRAIRDEQAETPGTARRRLKRDREYVAAFIEGCDYLLRMLPEAIQRVRERLA